MKFQLILSIIIISKEKVIFAKKEPFKRNKEVFTCKEDLDDAIDSFIGNDLIQVRGDEENSFPITKELRVLKIYYHNKIATTTYVGMKTFKMVQMMVQ